MQMAAALDARPAIGASMRQGGKAFPGAAEGEARRWRERSLRHPRPRPHSLLSVAPADATISNIRSASSPCRAAHPCRSLIVCQTSVDGLALARNQGAIVMDR